MNEQKKLYVMLSVIGLIIACILGVNFVNEYNSKKSLQKFNTTVEKSDKQMILLGRDSCGYCQMFIPLLNYMSEKYNFEYLYVNTDKISSKALNSVLEKLNINPDDFGTPHLSLVEGGKTIDEIAGYADEKELLAFLIKNGYAAADSILPLNYLDYPQYKELIKSETPEVIVIGQTSCSHCMMAKPALLDIADKYNVKINYLNVTELQEGDNSQEVLDEFNNSLDYLSNNSWGTPLMMVVKNESVLGTSNGYVSAEAYIKFLKEQGIIGE